MQTITTVGLDIAKSVFQVHGVDAAGQVVVGRQLKRRYVLAFFQKLPPCLVGIEACASAPLINEPCAGSERRHCLGLMPRVRWTAAAESSFKHTRGHHRFSV